MSICFYVFGNAPFYVIETKEGPNNVLLVLVRGKTPWRFLIVVVVAVIVILVVIFDFVVDASLE